jgi:hypothetical protein
MSSFSAPPISPNLDSSNLEQLKSAAIALEGSKKHEEALAKYEEVLVIQQRDLPVGHLDTHDTLTSIDRCIDQLKYASVDSGNLSRSAHSLLDQSKGDESYRLQEQTYQRGSWRRTVQIMKILWLRASVWRPRCSLNSDTLMHSACSNHY